MRVSVTGPGDFRACMLHSHGFLPAMPCGGRGVCGKCGITLLSGEWEVGGEPASVPCEALACRTCLLSATGDVDVPARMQQEAVRLEPAREMSFDDAGHGVTVGIDLGSTTVVASLLEDGHAVRQASARNRQAAWGADVMSRIAHCRRGGQRALDELREAASETIACVLDALAGERLGQVTRMVISGNTVMMCILHGVDPSPLGEFPYRAPRLDFPEISARELGLGCEASVFSVPCASGFIGGDVVCGLMCRNLQPGDLLLDIGTNCEMVLNANGRLIAASASAGPAFEGDGQFVSSAFPWSIAHVRDDGCFALAGEPGVWRPADSDAGMSLCGSGIIDYLAVRRKSGVLKANGQFADGRGGDRIGGVTVPASGISSIQLAKAAVAAGIKTLEALGECACGRVYLCGAFGENLDAANAQAVGLLPSVETAILGNTSLRGACMLACMPHRLEEARKRAGEIMAYNLTELDGYERRFIEGLSL